MTDATLTYSTELMQNYLQAEILAPDAKFEAQQTESGASLLFSIGTDSVLYVTKESPGTRSGWARFDLSSATITHDFAGNHAASCRDFASAQNVSANSGSGATIQLAMVVTDGVNDHLYLSLGNSDADTAWTSAPSWTAYPYDNPNYPLAHLKIVGVELSEATDGEYVVVDVVRDPSSTQALVSRYYIDVTKANGHAWQPHDVTVDLEAGTYQTCLGRRAGKPVDGLYTAGTIDGSAQFGYQPLYNPYKPTEPPSPSLFSLPGGAVPDAIAACRNADNSSDLYAAAHGTLYRLGGHEQQSGATMAAVLSSPRLDGVRSLFAATDGDDIVVWGLNGSDEVFYTSCPSAHVGTAQATWTVPLPILSGVEQVSPYLDRANSANTFFAHTGQSQLTKATKSPGTSIWTFRQITLDPPASTTPAQRFSSYTTRIVVTGTDGQPAPGTQVSLTSTNVSSVHINSLYYVLGPDPIEVTADAVGVVTIVEPLNSLAGTRLTVRAEGASVTIDPMAAAVGRAVALNTPEALTGATIKYPDGTTKHLVPPGATAADLQAVAVGNTQLAKASASLPAKAAKSASLSAAHTPAPALGSLDSVLVDAGDLFSWLEHEFESALEYAVELVEDEATGLWAFVVNLADESYHCVLDCVEKVAGAAQWLYGVLKTAAEDLLRYLEFLFEWDDIKRTKAVITNIVKTFLDHQVDEIEVVKAKFDQMIAEAEVAINGWAGVGDWSQLGNAATSTPNDGSTPDAGQSAPGSLLAHHFQGNAQNAATLKPVPSVDPVPGPVQVLIDTLAEEGDTVSNLIAELQALAAGAGRMSVGELLEKLVAILADAVLESARHVIDALFDILYDVAKAAVSVLDTPIHIPVLSDILEEIGIPEFSFLDAVCWVAAVPVTIAYKLVTERAPFPDNAETTFLIDAPDWTTLEAAFAAPAVTARPSALQAPAMLAASPMTISPETGRSVHVICHSVAGASGLVSAWLSSMEAAQETAENPFGIPSAVAGILSGVSAGGGSALVPHDPIANQAVSYISTATTGIRILAKILFSGPAQKKMTGRVVLKNLTVDDPRGVGSIIDAVLVIPAYACTAWHFYELSKDPAGGTRSIAIVDETSAIMSGIARVSYCVAVNVDEPDTKAVAVGVLAVSSICTAGLQFAEAPIN